MNAFRLLTSLLLLCGSLTGASYWQPEWAACVGLDWQQMREAQQITQVEQARAEAMEATSDIIKRRINAKREVILQLKRGSLTLFEAAAWFRFLNESPVECQDKYWVVWPGDSPGEKLCHQVLAWLGAEVHMDSDSQSVERLQAIQKSFQEHLKAHGTVELPSL